MLALLKGSVDMTDSYLPTDQVERIQKSKGVHIQKDTSMRIFILRMNNKKPPLDNVNARKCIAHAFNYDGFINEILKGYALLADAANDPQILALARGVCAEAGAALVRRHGFDPDEQRAFAEGCLAKYRDRAIVDPIERIEARKPFNPNPKLLQPLPWEVVRRKLLPKGHNLVTRLPSESQGDRRDPLRRILDHSYLVPMRPDQPSSCDT